MPGLRPSGEHGSKVRGNQGKTKNSRNQCHSRIIYFSFKIPALPENSAGVKTAHDPGVGCGKILLFFDRKDHEKNQTDAKTSLYTE
jgi:hypothetical protein